MKSFFERRTSPEKPKILYHGSTNGEITEFTPRLSHGTGSEHGEQVYASPSLMVASVFMAKEYIKQPWSSGFYGGAYCALITIPRDEFLQRDKGGYIYAIDSKSFSTKEGRGLDDQEYASSEPVTPETKVFYPSVLETMIELGVQVYFVNKDEYETLKDSTDDQKHLCLKKLRSENMVRGVNIKEIQM